MTTHDELRRYLLQQIGAARKEYFRLKAELAAMESCLPPGGYIGYYISKYNYPYHCLGHKDAVLPCSRDASKTTKRRHLGLDHNPNYRSALIELERSKTRQIKVETLEGITAHLDALKARWSFFKSLPPAGNIPAPESAEGKLLTDFSASRQTESIFGSIVKQYLSRTSELDEKAIDIQPNSTIG